MSSSFGSALHSLEEEKGDDETSTTATTVLADEKGYDDDNDNDDNNNNNNNENDDDSDDNDGDSTISVNTVVLQEDDNDGVDAAAAAAAVLSRKKQERDSDYEKRVLRNLDNVVWEMTVDRERNRILYSVYDPDIIAPDKKMHGDPAASLGDWGCSSPFYYGSGCTSPATAVSGYDVKIGGLEDEGGDGNSCCCCFRGCCCGRRGERKHVEERSSCLPPLPVCSHMLISHSYYVLPVLLFCVVYPIECTYLVVKECFSSERGST